jgi:23S rRNA A1618 N6-methylase RlmF
MKLNDYLSKIFNEGLNIDVMDDTFPENRILFLILGNTGLKLEVNLKEKTLLGITKETNKKINFKQSESFWAQFGISEPSSIKDLTNQLTNTNKKWIFFLNQIEKEYNLPDNQYKTLEIGNDFKVTNKILNPDLIKK